MKKQQAKFRAALGVVLVLIVAVLVVRSFLPSAPPWMKHRPGPGGRPNVPVAPKRENKGYYYLVDSNRGILVAVPLVMSQDPSKAAEELLRALMKGKSKGRVRSPIPKGSRLLGVQVKDGTAVADFDAAFQKNFWTGSDSEYLAVYAIANTLTEVSGVKRVQILIEGKNVESLGGHVDVGEPLTRDDSLIGGGSE